MHKRNALSRRDICIKSNLIQHRVADLPSFKSAKVVGAYCPKGTEVNTQYIINKALEAGKILALPATIQDEIYFYKISNLNYLYGDQMIISKFGIKEPSPSKAYLIDDIDILIVPGIAFDRNGYRLGYGRGYYDRYLSKKYIFSIGLAYELQVLDEDLPHEQFDQRVTAVATEEKIMHC